MKRYGAEVVDAKDVVERPAIVSASCWKNHRLWELGRLS